MIFKKTEVPESNKTKQVDTIQSWEVRWESRYGEFHTEVRKEAEFFISEIEAIQFKDALVNAFKLIRHTSGNHVTLRKR